MALRCSVTPNMIRSADSALVKTPIGHIRRRISRNLRSRMLVVRIVFQGARGNEKKWKHTTFRSLWAMHRCRRRSGHPDLEVPDLKTLVAIAGLDSA